MYIENFFLVSSIIPKSGETAKIHTVQWSYRPIETLHTDLNEPLQALKFVEYMHHYHCFKKKKYIYIKTKIESHLKSLTFSNSTVPISV